MTKHDGRLWLVRHFVVWQSTMVDCDWSVTLLFVIRQNKRRTIVSVRLIFSLYAMSTSHSATFVISYNVWCNVNTQCGNSFSRKMLFSQFHQYWSSVIIRLLALRASMIRLAVSTRVLKVLTGCRCWACWGHWQATWVVEMRVCCARHLLHICVFLCVYTLHLQLVVISNDKCGVYTL